MKRCRINRRLLVLAVMAAVALAAAGTALSLRSFTDPAGDSGGAPDITAFSVDNDASGNITFTVKTNQPTLSPDVLLEIEIDADQNVGTGGAGVGAEALAQFEGSRYDKPYDLRLWASNPYGYGPGYLSAPTTTAQMSYASGVARLVINKSVLGNTSAFNFRIFSGNTTNGDDRAPDAGFYSYSLAASSPPKLSFTKKQTLSEGQGFVFVKASCSTPCTAVRGTGTVKVGSTAIGKVLPVTKPVNGGSVSLALKLPPKVLTKALAALKSGKKTTVAFKVAALDSSGKVLASRTGTVFARRKFH